MKINRIVILGFVLIQVIAGCSQQEYHMPAEKGPETPENTFMQQMAAKSGGDFSKLSAEEQTKANTIAKGHGADAIKYMGIKTKG